MTNLLPQTEKKELRMVLLYKKTMVVLFFFSIFFLVLINILFILRMLLRVKVEEASILVFARENTLKQAQLQNFRAIISKENDNLSQVQNLWQGQLFLTPFFEKISALKNKDISLTNIILKKEAGKVKFQEKMFNAAQTRISGFAKSRESLLDFLRSLESDPQIKQPVKFLPSIWDKPNNISFSFDFQFLAPPTF